MAELTEEEKYRRKAIMLERALASADKMDKKDEAKAASTKAKERAQKASKKQQKAVEKETAQKQADKQGELVLG